MSFKYAPFLFVLMYFFYLESSLQLVPQSFVSFLSESPFAFKRLPLELQQKIFEFAWNKPIDYFKTMTMVRSSLNALVIKHELIPSENKKKQFINDFLKKRDSAITFKYYFTENNDGTHHKQAYSTLSLSSENTSAMKDIVLLIRYISCKLSKPVNEIANYYQCLQYIRFHEEFCFRAIIPSARVAWQGDQEAFIELTCGEYITIFDENYTVNSDFSNDIEWLIQKIQTSNARNITSITDPNEQICKRTKEKTACEMAERAIRSNADVAVMGLKLPNSLFNIILFYGTVIPFGILSDQPFKQYLEKLLGRNKNMSLHD